MAGGIGAGPGCWIVPSEGELGQFWQGHWGASVAALLQGRCGAHQPGLPALLPARRKPGIANWCTHCFSLPSC